MAEDYELPVWGVQPNWSEPILETLEWLSDVLTSDTTGAEQRIAYRLAPRRLIEARYNPMENERTFTDLALHRLGRNEWMLPLWFDTAKLTSGSAAGATRLNFSTAYHEFAAGGMAYIVGPDCFSGEAVRIDDIDANGIDLVVPLNTTWLAGSTVHPLRRGRFESPTGTLVTSRISELGLRFEIVEGNDLSAAGAWATSHSGIPVLTQASEWSDRLDLDLTWLSEEFDSELGRKYVTDEAGRAFRQQRHAFILLGAQEQFEFRQMLYRLRGRTQPVWVRTSADDLIVGATAASGVTQIDVQQVGLAYVGGPTDGRDRLYMPNGQIVQVTDANLIAGPLERLTLGTATTGALASYDRLSFIETCRLAADSVEIEHLGDTEGVARSTLSFVAFANRRTATTATNGIPETEMNDAPCGAVALDVFDIDASVHGGSNATAGKANGILVSGFNPSDTLFVTLPPGQTYVAYSVWGDPSPLDPGTSGATNRIHVLIDDDIDQVEVLGGGTYDGYEAARAAFGMQVLTGATKYRFYVQDNPIGDNSGGLSVRIYRL